jgi:Protein of unknown function (DUF1329)
MSVRRDGEKIGVNPPRVDFDKMLKPDSIANIEGCFSFCDDLTQYEWKYVDKRQLLVPLVRVQPQRQSQLVLRWENHNVHVVDGILLRGESNLLARRRFYLDEQTLLIVYGEGFDNAESVVMQYMLPQLAAAAPRVEGLWYPIYDQSKNATGN